MNLESILPPLPPRLRHLDEETDDAIEYGLACVRAGAVAALDEAMKLPGSLFDDGVQLDVRISAIRRLRDTIMEGK